jgi:hypothetical protein
LRIQIEQTQAHFDAARTAPRAALAKAENGLEELVRQAPAIVRRPLAAQGNFDQFVDHLEAGARDYERRADQLTRYPGRERDVHALKEAAAAYRAQREEILARGIGGYRPYYEARIAQLTRSIATYAESEVANTPNVELELARVVRAELVKLGPQRYDVEFDYHLEAAAEGVARPLAELRVLDTREEQALSSLRAQRGARAQSQDESLKAPGR